MTGLKWALANEQELIHLVQRELRRDHGFVPIFGAGVSDDSGVPLIYELQTYLAHCIVRALRLRSEDEGRKAWNPRTDVWPPVDETLTQERNAAHPWAVISTRIADVREKRRESPSLSIIQEASGAIAEWRSALLFLARLEIDKESGEPILGVPSDEVVDRFFLHATGGKRPGIVHQMLTQLAGPMRMQTFLTTNFDELLEDAFTEADLPIDIYEVPRETTLPSIDPRQKSRVLVKLHGGRYGLRGDYSLDAYPTSAEVENFASFFAGFQLRNRADDFRKATWKNHAFLLGLSGADRRMTALLREMQNLHCSGDDDDLNAKIFWLCFGDNDHRLVVDRLGGTRGDMSEPHDSDLVIVRCKHQGLLLLELYQQLTRSSPPKFAPFPSAARLRVPPASFSIQEQECNDRRLFDKNDRDRVGQQVHDRVSAIRDSYAGKGDPKYPRLVLMGGLKGCHGLASRMIQHYHRAKRDADRCVWMSLENITSNDELFEQLSDALAHAAGQFAWMPVILFDRNAKQIDELNRLTVGGKRWVIFLDARDGAGSARGTSQYSEDRPNGWLDIARYAPDSEPNAEADELDEVSANVDEFVDLIEKIGVYGNRNVSIVLAYHAETHDGQKTILHRRLEARFPKSIVSVKKEEAILLPYNEAHSAATNADGEAQIAATSADDEAQIAVSNASTGTWRDHYTPRESAERAIAWIREEDDRDERARRSFFLLGLVCAQRHRYPAMLLSDGFSPPAWLVPEKKLSDGRDAQEGCLDARFSRMFDTMDESKISPGYVSQLASDEKCVLRRSPGGFLWINARTKYELRGLGRPIIPGLNINTQIELEKIRKDPPEGSDEPDWTEACSASIGWEGSFGHLLGVPPLYALYRSHHFIAQWYERLLLSSNDPMAGLESLEHYLRAAACGMVVLSRTQASHDYDQPIEEIFQPDGEKRLEPCIPSEPAAQALSALAAASRLILRLKPYVLATGQPKASCRHLVHSRVALLHPLRDAAVRLLSRQSLLEKPAVREQIAMCTRLIDEITLDAIRLMRGIAREVSEHTRAFLRHRQYAEYLFVRDIRVNKSMPGYPHESKEKGFASVSDEIQAFDRKMARTVQQLHDGATRWTLEALQSADRGSVPVWPKNVTSSLELDFEYANWRRHGGTLCIATRAYPAASEELALALRVAVNGVLNKQFVRRLAYRPSISLGLSTYEKNYFDLNNPTGQAMEESLLEAMEESRQSAMEEPRSRKILVARYKWKWNSGTKDDLPDVAKLHDELIGRLMQSLDSINEISPQIKGRKKSARWFVEILKSMTRAIQTIIVMAEGMRYISSGDAVDEYVRRHYAEPAQRFFEVFNGLIYQLRSGEELSDSYRQIRQTTETQMSTVYAMSQQWSRAHRCLDAATELRPAVDPSDVLLSNGIIDLHRAQLYLLHARHVRAFGRGSQANGDESSIPASRNRVLEVLTGVVENDFGERFDQARSAAIELIKSLVDPLQQDPRQFDDEVKTRLERLHGAARLIDDASNALSRAQRVLVRKRKNVWWSTWLFELQAKVIEYRLLIRLELARVRLADPGKDLDHLTEELEGGLDGSQALPGSIADFGTQDSPRGVDSQMDRILENTQRMVRLDLVRSTRVLESYAVCTWCLELLGRVDPKAERIPTRMNMMWNRLRMARKHLRERWDLRRDLPPVVDPYVSTYVRVTLQLADDVCSTLSKINPDIE